ncbi:hypothetical protein [Alienimonas californiensis]|uniref:Uncharacterized protein n=1 Tax=Alienimonas californiensis TaxID=2527989 RepID=A0A517P4V7_9PLAN|nr:hypothetical protein [Alienimonas californiensis]QDT14422.1 hypothetical protein CA12_04950 [Alienimonas californiensis]
MHRRTPLLTVLIVAGLGAALPAGLRGGELEDRIKTLELQLQLAETTAALLEKENEALRQENAALKAKHAAAPAAADASEMPPAEGGEAADPFRVGAVWYGTLRGGKDGKEQMKWALSVSERTGDRIAGGVAFDVPGKPKFEMKFTGSAPTDGDGPVTVETERVGQAKLFMRGRLANGAVTGACSMTDPHGRKKYGSAALIARDRE